MVTVLFKNHVKIKSDEKSDGLETFLEVPDFFFEGRTPISQHRKRLEVIPTSRIRVIFGAPRPVKARRKN